MSRGRLPPLLWWWLAVLILRSRDYADRVSGVLWPALRDGVEVTGPGYLVRASAAVEIGWIIGLFVACGAVPFGVLRARRLQRRYDLRPADPDGTLRQAVGAYVDRAVPISSNLARADHVAFAYPAGGWRGGLAVFAPLMRTFRADPIRARVVVEHELSHLRNGEHLVSGVGSPLRTLARLGVPVLLLATAVAMVVPDRLGEARAQTIVFLADTLQQLLGLVAVLWLIELEADRAALDAVGRGSALGAVLPTGGSRWWLLSHPPRWVRTRCADAWDSTSRSTLLLLAYPAVLVLRWLLLVGFSLTALARIPTVDMGTGWDIIRESALDAAARSGREAFVLAALLAAWPVLAPGFHRLWGQVSAEASASVRPANLVAGASTALVALTVVSLI